MKEEEKEEEEEEKSKIIQKASYNSINWVDSWPNSILVVFDHENDVCIYM